MKKDEEVYKIYFNKICSLGWMPKHYTWHLNLFRSLSDWVFFLVFLLYIPNLWIVHVTSLNFSHLFSRRTVTVTDIQKNNKDTLRQIQRPQIYLKAYSHLLVQWRLEYTYVNFAQNPPPPPPIYSLNESTLVVDLNWQIFSWKSVVNDVHRLWFLELFIASVDKSGKIL